MKRLTWYERQKERKSSPFFRLLQYNFRFRLALASIISLMLILAIHRFENCYQNNYSEDCLAADVWSIISVNNIKNFSVVTAAILYILEAGKRKEKEHLDAWKLITAQNEAKVVHSIARIQAVELLSSDGFSLDKQDFEGANLEQLEMPFGQLRQSNLANTVLIRANFQQTDLTGTNLTHADLTEANLSHANLTDADLTGANLTDANLKGANLTRTNFHGANLTYAQWDQPEIAQLLKENSSEKSKS